MGPPGLTLGCRILLVCPVVMACSHRFLWTLAHPSNSRFTISYRAQPHQTIAAHQEQPNAAGYKAGGACT